MLIKLLRRVLQQRDAPNFSQPSLGPSQAQRRAPPRSTAELLAASITSAQRGELEIANEVLAEVIVREPQNAGAHNLLGNVLRAQDRIADAIASYERAVTIDPKMASAHSNLALSLRDLGRYEEARVRLEHAARLDTEDPMIAVNLAALLFDIGHYDEALGRIEAVLAQWPDHREAHIIRGTRLLRRCDYARGWMEYEWRDRDAGREGPDAFDYPAWDGSPIHDGHLLVCCEQGLGDQVMFASCFADLERVAPRCIVECDARLKSLFARSFPDFNIYVHRRHAEQGWLADGLVPIAKTWSGSLPGRFRREASDFPQRTHYLRADAGKMAAWKRILESLGPGLKIGISWRGGTGLTRRDLRSIPLDQWIPLLNHRGAHFISLQYGDCRAEIEGVSASTCLTIPHWDAVIADYDETAALISSLDLVITVQTAIAHLAGALGRPTWILVPRIAEWRYGETGECMPWYPTARLFRQTGTEGWHGVMSRIGTTLEAKIVLALKDQ